MTDYFPKMRTVDEETQPWNTDFVIPPRVQAITFDAAGYQAWADSLVPELAAVCPQVADDREQTAARNGRWLTDVKKYIPVGDHHILFAYRIPPFEIKRNAIRYVGKITHGTAESFVHERVVLPVKLSARRTVSTAFNDVIYVPVLSEIKAASRLAAPHALLPWMSLTPLEVFTQRPLIKRARGNVGIAGIGMGWFAGQVLDRKRVRHVTIVEKNASILEYFGQRLLAKYGSRRLTLVHGDAYLHNWHAYDVSLWDIWPCVGDAAWDKEFLAICNGLRNEGRVCEGWTQRGYGPDSYRKNV